MAWAADAEATWAFVRRFFDALAASGVEAVCVSPGSRSTPLALAAAETPGLEATVHLDERAAGFFALGRAKASRRPVALVCTSGTAAANYLPAVVEAHHSATPLLVLTADRPPELRDWGAGQTIDQLKLFGSFARAFVEMPIAAGTGEAQGRTAERIAARAVATAWRAPAGPVHLNWPLREPLEPPPAAAAASASAAGGASTPSPRLTSPLGPPGRSSPPTDEEIAWLDALVRAEAKGVVCAGVLDATEDDAAAVARFAARAGWPVLADPLSQLRCGPHVASAPIVTTSEWLLRDASFAGAAAARAVLRLGGAPVSKAQRLWLGAHPPEALWLVDAAGRFEEPSHLVTRHVPAAPAALLAAVEGRLAASGFARGAAAPWCHAWTAADAAARAQATAPRPSTALVEADVVRALAEAVPDGATVFLSNSMPIRDADVDWPSSQRRVRFVGNRGANGIDGIPSTALGVTAGSDGPVVLLTGDLALLHDMGGLLAARDVAGSLTIVVLDNDGGGIFSFLPIAERAGKGAFEALFRTPHGRELGRLAPFFELPFADAPDDETLRKALSESIGAPGVRIVRVPIDRDANVAAFRAATSAAAAVASEAAERFPA